MERQLRVVDAPQLGGLPVVEGSEPHVQDGTAA